MCDISLSTVDEDHFLRCRKGFDDYAVFRARISGTSENTSEYLISLLVEWVSNHPNLRTSIMQLMLAVVNNELECHVSLTNMDEEDECVYNMEGSKVR